MTLVFMGNPEFAVPSLERLAKSRHQILSVVTNPDTEQGRGRRFLPPPIKRTALRLGYPVLQPGRLRDPAFIGQLEEMAPDLFVIVAFRILPDEVVAMPKIGAINLHASLLPRYRGAAPIQWVIVNGECETGLTTFLIDSGVDTGKILLQRRVTIGEDETSGELHDRLMEIGADLLVETIDGLHVGTVIPIPQQGERGPRAPKLSKDDGRIPWTKSASEIRNFIRGMNPFPGACTGWRGGTLKIHRADTIDWETDVGPGTILKTDPREGVTVATGDKRGLLLREVQLPGKRPITSAEWVRGYRVEAGEQLGEL
ncbi:MAG: methionyl-tRNA formyltransferase [Candidatus Latescibacteria bacterium]|nr:methionyl-tRNA formyltransferase [Candidatus Latescibacterota bacterium]